MIDQESIHNQCLSGNPKERIRGLNQLKNFSSLPHKEHAWEDLHKLTDDQDSSVRSEATRILGFVFSQVPDKQKAWDDLIKLTNDEDEGVREETVFSFDLDIAFSHVPNKQKAWCDLIKLISDPDSWLKDEAASALDFAFSQVPDKQQAWNDLHELTIDPDYGVRQWAAIVLGSVFYDLPDKQQAWKDLHKLTNDQDSRVRSGAASAFLYASSHLPDKQQAWSDLIKLTNDKDEHVRYDAAQALGTLFYGVPDKQQAWNDLHRLTNSQDNWIRYNAAKALGFVFSQVPDRYQAWKDLIKLSNDCDERVKAYANHSLGKVSIFDVSQTENDEDYKKALENAIDFFEKSLRESSWLWGKQDNPSQFCLPFYLSFHTILFRRQGAKEEVDKYIAEAKDAIKGSKSKEMLLAAVENLPNALKEIQNLSDLNLEIKKSELNNFRYYCELVEESMRGAEETAPFATMALRKGLPILDKNLKWILEEIQEKARKTCKESKGTATEEIARVVSREVQKWEIGSQEEMTQKVEDIAYLLKTKVADLPENRYLINKIEAMKHEINLEKQYDALLFVIGQIPTMKVVSDQELDQKLDQKLQNLDLIFGEIIYVKDKLSCISFDITKIKLNSADVISNLKTMKEELEKISKIEGLNTLSIEKLDSMQAKKLNDLNKDILERLSDIKILIYESSKDNCEFYQEFSKRLDELKQSKLDSLLQRYSAAISLIDFVISGISIAR